MQIKSHGMILKAQDAAWAILKESKVTPDNYKIWKYPHKLEHGLLMMLEEAAREGDDVKDLEEAISVWREVGETIVKDAGEFGWTETAVRKVKPYRRPKG